MKIKAAIVAASILMSCAPEKPRYGIEMGEFRQYLVQLELWSDYFGKPIDVYNLDLHAEFGPDSSCRQEIHLITIDETWWSSHTDGLERQAHMFRLLGYCVLHRAPVLSTHPDGRPVSLLYPSGITGKQFGQYNSDYLYELFEIDKVDFEYQCKIHGCDSPPW